jgi:predicted O-methyltransferase YrrM
VPARASSGSAKIDRVLSLVKFIGWTAGVVAQEAWTTPRVLDCAERCATGRRRLAEIGVWQGAVTCRMRAAMALDGVLFAIDPYPPGRLGFNYQRIIARREVARIARGDVVWLRMRGAEASLHPAIQAAPFDLVFVDADHTIAGLTENWEAWSPLIAADGLLALHEAGTPGGLSAHGKSRFCDTIARRDPRFDVMEVVEHLLVLRRR